MSVLTDYLIGTAVLALIMSLWLYIQRRWLASFPSSGEADALANRNGCHGCSCNGEQCSNQNSIQQQREGC